ncbi:RDD family protein [Salinibacterium sp. G-O1]|uniref:RDD family protein n=1 Tax=Salinibacterium sp. G-O1 TaxID=3046208 RepID=UPI0024BA6591|nr:RDD family protein [Salinibacterium sp. G-O1]MDJ0336547.1 RDD family protein [Salinibacterium sp. G-O1]
MAREDSVEHDEDLQELVTGEAVALDLRPSSFVLRAAGTIIDFIVYFGSYIAIVIVMITLADQLGLDQALITAISVVALVLCLVVIPTAVETLSQGKSLGKLAVGSRIVRDDGGSIGFRHAFIRALTGIFEIFMTFGGMAAIIALLNGRAKRLGDLVAGTYSQNERVSKLVTPVYGVPTALAEWARTADVATLPDALARRVAAFLAQAASLTPETRERLSRELADEVSVFVSPVPAGNAELFLAAVVSVRRDRESAALDLERAGLERLAPVLGGMPRGFPDRG